MQENTKIFNIISQWETKIKAMVKYTCIRMAYFFRTNVNTPNATQGKLDASHTAG